MQTSRTVQIVRHAQQVILKRLRIVKGLSAAKGTDKTQRTHDFVDRTELRRRSIRYQDLIQVPSIFAFLNNPIDRRNSAKLKCILALESQKSSLKLT